MKTSKFMLAVGATIPIFLAACGGANKSAPNTMWPYPYTTGDAAHAKAVAAQPAPPSKPHAAASSKETDVKVSQVPEDTKLNPAELATLMHHVRNQIVYKTRNVPQSEYEEVIRPAIAGQLSEAGFPEKDVSQILAEVDYSRRVQGKR